MLGALVKEFETKESSAQETTATVFRNFAPPSEIGAMDGFNTAGWSTEEINDLEEEQVDEVVEIPLIQGLREACGRRGVGRTLLFFLLAERRGSSPACCENAL